MNERGLTFVEVMVAAILFGMIAGTVGQAISQDTQAARILTAHIGPEIRARAAMDRIASDLRMAGEWGEDRNHNGEFESTEDTNGNGVLDANWNLKDGTALATSISFNRRIDLMDGSGGLLQSGIYSRRVTWRLSGTDLLREWERTLSSGRVQTLRTVVARGISGLRFSRKGQVVHVEVDMRLPETISRAGFETYRTAVWLRN